MYDTQKIYENVIRHETLCDGTAVLAPPDGFELGYKQVNGECITLFDSYQKNKKHSRMAIWDFIITKDGVSLRINQKSIDTDLVLAIADSYNRLMKLIEPYEKAVSV